MKKKYKITNEDYKKLKNGTIKYFVAYYQHVRYGSRFSWWYIFWNNLFNKYGKASYKRPYEFKYYIIYVYAVDKPENLFWNDAARKEFEKEKQLKPGDRVTVGLLHINDDEVNFWSAGVNEYVVLKDHWVKIGFQMGM